MIGVAIFVMARVFVAEGGADLRATARWSFVLFWLGSTGGALARLFGPRFASLASRARDLSLAYASALLVHLAIVVRLLVTGAPPQASELIFFGLAVLFTYALAFFSATKLTTRLNPIMWRTLRTVGVEYISLVFIADFNKNLFDERLLNALYYVPFFALAVAAPLLRLAAYIKRIIDKRKTLIALHQLTVDGVRAHESIPDTLTRVH